jgi:hypothetical protein
MWHLCKEHAEGEWLDKLIDHTNALIEKHHYHREDINKWFEVCRVQFEVYLEVRDSLFDLEKGWKTATTEEVFHTPYVLLDGRTVYLRGKFDGSDVKGQSRVRLEEHKSTGDVKEEQRERQLSFDLQTMTYAIAYEEVHGRLVTDVGYNVILRPLSGGKHSIRPHKASANKVAESPERFYGRLGKEIASDPEYFFYRWESQLSQDDIMLFVNTCLDPVLANLCDDFEWWDYCKEQDNAGEIVWLVYDSDVRRERFPEHTRRHYRLPYGVYNPIAEGGSTSLDRFLLDGDMTGLQRAEVLFPELEEL